MIRSLLLTILWGGTIALTPGGIVAQAQEEATQQASPWKDRAEYDAYDAMVQATDPKQKTQMADQYLVDYPETNFQKEVLELKLQAFQTSNDTANMTATAEEILEIDPNNIRALLVLSYLFPRSADPADYAYQQNMSKADDYARRGLSAVNDMEAGQGVTPQQLTKQKEQSSAVFHQTAGFIALQRENFSGAIRELKAALDINTTDALGFYWLGLSYVTPKPPNYDQGIWSLARAVSISGNTALPAATKLTVRQYLTDFYEVRHGSTEGLDEILAQATSAPYPPYGFHVESRAELEPEPEPEPIPVPQRELTVKAEELTTFDVIVEYLQAGGLKEEDTFTLLQGAVMTLPGKVVSATPANAPTTLLLAVDPNLALEAGKSDVEVTLVAPHSSALNVGDDISFEGAVDSYTSNPFLLKFTEATIVP
jgi:hypothetical protein